MQVHGDPLRRRRGLGGARAVRPAQYAELGGARAVPPAQRAGVELRRRRQVCSLHRGDVDSFSACFLPCMSPIDRHRLVSDVLDGRCTLLARLSTNSCGIGQGIHIMWGTLIHVWEYMLIQGVRVRTGIHVWKVVVKFLGKQRLRVRVL